MTAFILSTISWVQFLLVFLAASLVWIAWVYKDNLLGKKPPPPGSPSPKKRTWQVSETETDDEIFEPGRRSKNEHPVPFNTLDFGEENEIEEPGNQQTEEDEFGQMEELIATIEQVVINNRTADKERMLAELKPHLQQHAGLFRPPFKYAIHNFIARVCLKEAGIAITEADTNALWL